MNILLLDATSVAGNVDTDFTVPANGRWRVLYGRVVLTTDATVANRWVRPGAYQDDGTTRKICLCAGKEQTASQTAYEYSIMQGVYRETAFINSVIQVPMANDLILEPGEVLKVSIENGVAGDSYEVHWVVADIGTRR